MKRADTPQAKPVHLNSLFDIRFYYCRTLHDVHGGTRSTDDMKRVTCKACIAKLDALEAKP